MTSSPTALIQAMLDEAAATLASGGAERCDAMGKSQSELLTWLQFFRDGSSSGTAVELLDGTRAALLEAATFVACGLGRPSLVSIRTQVDLLLGYTFFCDHPREWLHLSEADEGFMLRSDLLAYHGKVFPGFTSRLAMIESRNGSLKQVYKVLSAHIHSQSAYTAPKAATPGAMICTKEFLESVVDLQAKVSLRLSDYLVALFADRWQDLPPAIPDRINSALSDKQKEKFWS